MYEVDSFSLTDNKMSYFRINTITLYSSIPPGGGGGGYSGFQVTGMIEGFFWGLKFSIPGFFWVGKFGK